MQQTLEIPHNIENVALTSGMVCDLLKLSGGTWRGWVSSGRAPKSDGKIDSRTPTWKLTTVVEYVRNAPGGRLGYPVG